MGTSFHDMALNGYLLACTVTRHCVESGRTTLLGKDLPVCGFVPNAFFLSPQFIEVKYDSAH